MISAALLAQIRTAVTGTMQSTGTVLAYSLASDGIGGGTVTYTASGTAVCTVAPPRPTGMESIGSDQVRSVSEWLVCFPFGTSVGLKDRVQSGGQTFEVRASNVGQSGAVAVALRCEVVE